MPDLRPITIVGGGLGGLTLGIGLRQRGIPVSVLEAGQYPRHRVCGEFVNGRGVETLARLQLRELFVKAGAIGASTAAFFVRQAQSPVRPLPTPALCLSRWVMDELLAREFQRLGGELRENRRWQETEFGPGIVRASGRRPARAQNPWRWFGLKSHWRNVHPQADVEIHVVPEGYVGLCRLDGGTVNVCGLFRRRVGAGELPGGGLDLLRGVPGTTLHQRFAAAELDRDSFCSVAGLSLAPQSAVENTECRIGDALTMIPPVTGNGMSMAFESAELAIEPLTAFSRGECSWTQAQLQIACSCDAAFARRLFWAKILQWLLFSPLVHGRAGLVWLRSEWFWRLMFTRTR